MIFKNCTLHKILIKLKIKWLGFKGELRNPHKILVRETEGKRPLVKPLNK
jgi:hypothetical protein